MSAVVHWLHLVSAILAVGGVAFARLVLIPSAASLPEAERNTLMEGVHTRFRQMLWISIGVLLITGLYNVGVAAAAGLLSQPMYLYALIAKIVLALVIFKIAFMLSIPGPAFSGVKAKRPRWLMINFVLGLAVVLLGAVLRRM